MIGKTLLVIGLFMTGVAIICQVPCIKEPIVKFLHQHFKFNKLFNTCPYHAVLNLLSSVGVPGLTDSRDSESGETFIIYRYGRLFTKEELAHYKGESDSPGLYLAIVGRMYDVSAGESHYAPGKGYSFFTGRDGTRAFVTGRFTESGLVEDIVGLELSQLIELEQWMNFYEKTYSYVGKVIGHFYNEKGQPTPALLEAEERLKSAYVEKSVQDDHRRRFPPCNSAWSQQRGGSISCSNKSGGISRDWVGVPRQYHAPGSKSQPVCVCVRTSGPPSEGSDRGTDNGDLDNPHLKEYDDCHPQAISCNLPAPKKQ